VCVVVGGERSAGAEGGVTHWVLSMENKKVKNLFSSVFLVVVGGQCCRLWPSCTHWVVHGSPVQLGSVPVGQISIFSSVGDVTYMSAFAHVLGVPA
jgi:hypothetical protein